MNIHILYISSFLISYIIVYLFKKDMNNLIILDKSIWIKLYCFITIGLIHLIWLFNALLLHKTDVLGFIGYPFYLVFGILLFTFSIKNENENENKNKNENENENEISNLLNKYLNILFLTYLLISCIIIGCIPHSFKTDVIKRINKKIDFLNR